MAFVALITMDTVNCGIRANRIGGTKTPVNRGHFHAKFKEDPLREEGIYRNRESTKRVQKFSGALIDGCFLEKLLSLSLLQPLQL